MTRKKAASKKGGSRSSRLSKLSRCPPATAGGFDNAQAYAGAGVPPVIGGRIGVSGLVEGSFSFAPGSSC